MIYSLLLMLPYLFWKYFSNNTHSSTTSNCKVLCQRLRRYALQDMDKFSLKDSGRGDSDAGDSDCEMGRDSPIDRLLGDGFGDLFHSDGHHRLHPGEKRSPADLYVHVRPCWAPFYHREWWHSSAWAHSSLTVYDAISNTLFMMTWCS